MVGLGGVGHTCTGNRSIGDLVESGDDLEGRRILDDRSALGDVVVDLEVLRTTRTVAAELTHEG